MIKLINNQNPLAIFLMGPTSSGKTSLAISLYQQIKSKIVSVDSALIYRGMNIGTAKPSPKQLKEIPHRLIDIIDPSEYYSMANFYQDALEEMKKITASGYIPILVGGSMSYFRTLLKGLSPLPPANYELRMHIKRKSETLGKKFLYQQLQIIDPISANHIHPNDLYRISRALEVFFSFWNYFK